MTEKKTESSHELRPHTTGITTVTLALALASSESSLDSERGGAWEEEEVREEFQSYSYSMARDTIEGPRAPAVKLTPGDCMQCLPACTDPGPGDPNWGDPSR